MATTWFNELFVVLSRLVGVLKTWVGSQQIMRHTHNAGQRTKATASQQPVIDIIWQLFYTVVMCHRL